MLITISADDDNDYEDVDLNATYEEYTSRQAEPPTEVENELLYLRRVDFILVYHIALTIFMQKQFTEAHEVGIVNDILIAIHSGRLRIHIYILHTHDYIHLTATSGI